MSKFLNKVSYIICYREASEGRKQALHFVLKKVRLDFPEIEILIIEQDSKSKLSIDDNLNIRHIFVQNEGLFNRSWAFNCAAKNTTKEILVFADADVFLEKEKFITCLNASEEFEAITPNKIEITNISIDQETGDTLQILNIRKLYSFAGGMLILTREAYDKIGGWDERFEGWGGEDNAMSHLIYNRLTSKTFNLENFHIDHPNEFIIGKNQPKYKSNKGLLEEVLTRNGPSLDQYILQLKSSDLGNSEKYNSSHSPPSERPLQFVLAVTTFNRLSFLKKCIDSFLNTRADSISWQFIVADDNSTDGTQEYLAELKKKHNAIIIHNHQTGIHRQVNSIIHQLSKMTYDLCFRCDDDIEFLKSGWDELYWNTIQRTGYHHLIFYDKNWNPHSNLSRPIHSGQLISNCHPDSVQGALYTITNKVINKVGYFDEQQFGASGLGHVDYSFRCCRAGFNVLTSPFDVEHSNQYIRLQTIQKYSSTSSLKSKSKFNSKSILAIKKYLLSQNRIYIPYNENFHDKVKADTKSSLDNSRYNKGAVKRYKKADATYYPERGFSGILGFILKRLYNLSIDLKLYFIPWGIIILGKSLNKISIHLLNIEQ